MTNTQLQNIITQGEGISVEFKTSKDKLNKDAFESICAFLNRKGGYSILGVNDKKEIVGVSENAIQAILDTLAVNANNPQKLNPPYYFSPELIALEGKQVIVVYIPESSQVHNTAGKIFDRNEDGDFNITNNGDLVAQLYLRKQKAYSENEVFPYVEITDFKADLFDKVRQLVKNQRPNHPWLAVSNEDLLKSSGFYKKDMLTGKEGFTLASVLLLGKDETVLSVLPHHKTDAILRVENTDRYDDRDDIRVNLIESYARLIDFIAKHLPDKFYIEGEQRISVRDHIFREVIGNILIHREYASAFPAKLIIEKDRVITENWNKPYHQGNIDPTNFTPYPKNPMIARFFKEIGWVDELGSGVRNVFKFTELYTPGTVPEFVEGDIFKTIIPLTLNTVEETVEETIVRLMRANSSVTTNEMAEATGLKPRGVEYNLDKLKKAGKIKREGPTKGGVWIVLS